MIRINDDWVVDVDQYNYILKKDMHREEKSRDGKSMVPVYNAVGYYASLRKALDALGGKLSGTSSEGARGRFAKPCRPFVSARLNGNDLWRR